MPPTQHPAELGNVGGNATARNPPIRDSHIHCAALHNHTDHKVTPTARQRHHTQVAILRIWRGLESRAIAVPRIRMSNTDSAHPRRSDAHRSRAPRRGVRSRDCGSRRIAKCSRIVRSRKESNSDHMESNHMESNSNRSNSNGTRLLDSRDPAHTGNRFGMVMPRRARHRNQRSVRVPQG